MHVNVKNDQQHSATKCWRPVGCGAGFDNGAAAAAVAAAAAATAAAATAAAAAAATAAAGTVTSAAAVFHPPPLPSPLPPPQNIESMLACEFHAKRVRRQLTAVALRRTRRSSYL